ncbi:hypothetical protein ON010_g899 [Phytophthora cinnamomi]|nr:hypothetical protein ON010_g899 [Phytophthora cinnamomi]
MKSDRPGEKTWWSGLHRTYTHVNFRLGKRSTVFLGDHATGMVELLIVLENKVQRFPVEAASTASRHQARLVMKAKTHRERFKVLRRQDDVLVLISVIILLRHGYLSTRFTSGLGEKDPRRSSTGNVPS